MLRRAVAADAGAIDRCNRANLAENYPRDFYEWVFASQGPVVFVVDTAPTQSSLVDDDNNTSTPNRETPNTHIGGYIVMIPQQDARGRVFGHVYSLAVQPEYRRQGFAHQLLTAAEIGLKQAYPTLEYFALHVRKKNKPAFKLYNGHDYVRAKVVKRYYSNPKEDALYMKKAAR